MTKKNIWKNVIIIGGLLTVLAVATFSWFVFNGSGEVGTLDANVVDAAFIKVSKDEGLTWDNNLELDLGTVVTLRETTGNGVDFYEPVYDGVDSIGGYVKSANENVCYESQFSFKTDANQNLYLTNESYIIPADTNSNNKNFSEFGNYSKDYIAGAIRVGFFEVTAEGEYIPSFVWVPNTKIQFDRENNRIVEDGSVEDYYSYYADGEEPGFKKVMTNGQESGVSDIFVWGSLEQNDVKPVLKFDKSTDEVSDDGNMVKKIAVRVWVEGTDRECARELYEGRFKMFFKFRTLRGGGNEE